MTDINPCPPTVCLHVQLDHCQILNCYKYLKNPRPLNTEYREVLVQVLVISLNFFLNKVLSTQFERAVRSFCFSKSTLTLLAATLLTRPQGLPGVQWCSWVFGVWRSYCQTRLRSTASDAPSGEDQTPISGCGNLLKIQLMRACLLPFKCLLNRKGKIRAKSKNTFHLVFHPWGSIFKKLFW